MTPTRAVLFDIGGTLVDEPEVDLGARIAAALGAGPERAETIQDLVLRNVFTAAALAERLRADLGLADEPTAVVRELWDAARADLIEVPFAETCLAALATAGVKVGVLANLSSAAAEGFRIACPTLVSWIETWTLSCEHGSTKPSATIFQAALDALGVAPAQVLVVGDSLEQDVAPALALGMSAVWLRRNEAAAAHVVEVDPHGAPFPVPAVPRGAVVARTLSDVRRIALTWMWTDRKRHGLTLPLPV
jgi:HAD superfamily hydrolase (TIGR01493 family)